MITNSILTKDVLALINDLEVKLANTKEQAELHKGDDEATIALSATISTLEDVLHSLNELLDKSIEAEWIRWNRIP